VWRGNYDIILIAVSIEYRNVTDRRTDIQTDGQNYYINIARQRVDRKKYST